jgi:aspartate/methionine/tyrosine aminotransferase
MSLRAANTDFPCIEDVLNKYGNIPNLTKLAMGSVRWNPPQKALGLLMERVTEVSVHKYGDLNGIEELRGHIAQMLHRKGSNLLTRLSPDPCIHVH